MNSLKPKCDPVIYKMHLSYMIQCFKGRTVGLLADRD